MKSKKQPHAMRFSPAKKIICGAKTRNGTLCKSKPVINKKRCRMHGGAQGSGAPLGNCNALKTSEHTYSSKCKRKFIKRLVNNTNILIEELLSKNLIN